MRARNDPTLLRGADIYVDEAGLLDTPKALALVREAERAGARVIFQGDTEQMAAVGRGQPIKLLQDELKLGMHVPRASISRRQLTVADKQLAADLSSGDAEKFAGAVRQMLDRGMIRQTSPDEAVETVAKEIVESRAKGAMSWPSPPSIGLVTLWPNVSMISMWKRWAAKIRRRSHHRRAPRSGQGPQFSRVAGARRRPLENEFATGNGCAAPVLALELHRPGRGASADKLRGGRVSSLMALTELAQQRRLSIQFQSTDINIRIPLSMTGDFFSGAGVGECSEEDSAAAC